MIPRKSNTKIFVNLPVKDLNKTKTFFSKLGFKFNPKFTDNKAACMVIGENIYSMLITEKFFKTFIKKKIVNAKKNVEVLIALSVDKKKIVDLMVDKAIKAGGREPRKPTDYGWMYTRAFEDINGHVWEIFYMDEKNKK